MSRSPADESVFHAVACPTRRALLDALAAGEQNVGVLVEKLHVTQSAVSNNCAATGPVIDVQVTALGSGASGHVESDPEAIQIKWLHRALGRGYTNTGSRYDRGAERDGGGQRDPVFRFKFLL